MFYGFEYAISYPYILLCLYLLNLAEVEVVSRLIARIISFSITVFDLISKQSA